MFIIKKPLFRMNLGTTRGGREGVKNAVKIDLWYGIFIYTNKDLIWFVPF